VWTLNLEAAILNGLWSFLSATPESAGKTKAKSPPLRVKEENDDEKVPKRTTRKKPPKTAVSAKNYRKTIPEGKPGCLEGVKILFTGTLTMDRNTSVATAIKYGGEVVTKLEDTDYIVLGLRAGPKKLQVINELELETITEDEFFQILEDGVSEEKRQRMAARRRADEEADE
jgi:NAD-dependent DNA ligase